MSPDVDPHPAIIPHDRRAWFCRVFRRYGRHLVRKNFNAVRLSRGGADHFAQFDAHDGPTLLLLNHQSWWDPILTTALVDRFTPQRTVFAPMDRAMVEQFRFMRKLGLFGVDLDRDDAFKAMVQYAAGLAATSDRPSFWITPQGRFADPRAPLELRPGAAAIASRLERDGWPPHAMCLAIELNFWQDRKPEVLLLARPCPRPERPTMSQWQRSMSETLASAMCDLAGLATARNPAAFDTILGRGASGVNPVYDAILRVSGRRPDIAVHSPRTDATP